MLLKIYATADPQGFVLGAYSRSMLVCYGIVRMEIMDQSLCQYCSEYSCNYKSADEFVVPI